MPRGVVTKESARDHWTKALKKRLVSTDGVTAFSSNDLIDRTRTRLEAELKALQHLTTLTYARINSLSVTARLPAEVLMHVFSMLSECDPPGSKPFSRTRSGENQPLGWINATHVCRRWREVALSAPGLWTNVGAPQTVPWMEEMLVRSKQVPFILSACLTLDRKICNFIVKALGPTYTCRMKGFHLSEKDARSDRGNDLELEMDTLRTHVLKNLNRPAPMLESLAFKDVKECYKRPTHALFANELPRLRHFADNVGLKQFWNAPYMRNLKSLDLNFGWEFSASNLFALLKESPTLEDLKIRITYSSHKKRYEGDVVSLPSLKTLSVDSSESAVCANVLSSIAIPPSARQEYRIRDVFPEQQPFVLPVSTGLVDTGDVATRPCPSIIRLKCSSRDVRSINEPSLRAWLPDEDENAPPHYFLQFRVFNSDPAPKHAAAVKQLLDAFDISKVEYLSLDSKRLDDGFRNLLADAFSRMSVLAWLTLKGRGVGPLLGYLGKTHIVPPDPEDEEQETQETLFFPRLERFCVASMPFDQALSDVLVEAIRKRNKCKRRLFRMVLSGCEGSKPLVRRLSRLVCDLSHDGTQ